MRKRKSIALSLVIVCALMPLAACTIQITPPQPQPMADQRSPNESQLVDEGIQYVCEEVFRLIIENGSPGQSDDLYEASMAYRDAGQISNEHPRARSLGASLSGFHQILEQLREAESQGVVIPEKDSQEMVETVSAAMGLVLETFDQTCGN